MLMPPATSPINSWHGCCAGQTISAQHAGHIDQTQTCNLGGVMSSYQYFYVDKNNQTFADELKAFGLAHLLYALLFRQYGGTDTRYDVRIGDCGSYYQL